MKAAIKNVTINNNDDLVTFAQTIDFNELFDYLKAHTKVTCTFEQPEITTRHGEVYIRFTSDNIASQTGAFAAILEKCFLHSFSNKVFRDKDTGELAYWVTVHFDYTHKGGGSNGMEVTTAWYSESKGWVFRNAGSR